MTISGNYPSPVFVNGYACMNCTDVSRAQKNIDPADATKGAFDAKAKKLEAHEKLEKTEATLFDREKIAAALAAAQNAAAQAVAQRHAVQPAHPAYGAAGDFVQKGGMVNLVA